MRKPSIAFLLFITVLFASCGTLTENEVVDDTTAPTVIRPEFLDVGTDLSYKCFDGAHLMQYNNMKTDDYISAVAYYESEGGRVYGSSEIGAMLSTVLSFEEEYYVISYNGNKNELYITRSAKGCELPVIEKTGDKICNAGVTQCYSSEISDMSYIVRLEDGSFILVDGGYRYHASEIYKTLCEMNGSEENIRIRAWLITHSHDDHYQAFSDFSKKYADKVKLDYVFCSPANIEYADKYLQTEVITDAALYDGAKLFFVHTGMVFDFASVKLEILLTPEHLYKKNAPEDFNETSVIYRIKNDDGSVIFLGDCGASASEWLVKTYGTALKSDFVQVSHHGCETATAELYDCIQAPTLFWPCHELLLSSDRGMYVKQHIIEAEYSKEHILHGYGRATRELSYRPTYEYLDLMPKSVNNIEASPTVSDVKLDNGVISYKVTASQGKRLDPYVFFTLENVDVEKYNALRIVIDSDAAKNGKLYFTAGDTIKFSERVTESLCEQGASNDGTMTTVLYLADHKEFFGKLTSLRFDLGVVDGQIVKIYSVEAFYVDTDK